MDGSVELADAVKKAKRVYICGNGGSAANAIHIANDWISCGIKAHALTADVATLTAIANDVNYDSIFARQVQTLGERGDLLVALSGSGKSMNIIAALEAAKAQGMQTWAIVGEYNHPDIPAAKIAHRTIRFGEDMQQAEERQLYLGHKVMRCLRAG